MDIQEVSVKGITGTKLKISFRPHGEQFPPETPDMFFSTSFPRLSLAQIEELRVTAPIMAAMMDRIWANMEELKITSVCLTPNDVTLILRVKEKHQDDAKKAVKKLIKGEETHETA